MTTRASAKLADPIPLDDYQEGWIAGARKGAQAGAEWGYTKGVAAGVEAAIQQFKVDSLTGGRFQQATLKAFRDWLDANAGTEVAKAAFQSGAAHQQREMDDHLARLAGLQTTRTASRQMVVQRDAAGQVTGATTIDSETLGVPLAPHRQGRLA